MDLLVVITSAVDLYAGQAEKEGTVESLVPWTLFGQPADGRRTVVGGARVVSGAETKII